MCWDDLFTALQKSRLEQGIKQLQLDVFTVDHPSFYRACSVMQAVSGPWGDIFYTDFACLCRDIFWLSGNKVFATACSLSWLTCWWKGVGKVFCLILLCCTVEQTASQRDSRVQTGSLACKAQPSNIHIVESHIKGSHFKDMSDNLGHFLIAFSLLCCEIPLDFSVVDSMPLALITCLLSLTCLFFF